ncbi:hypothetical protein B484DRAFT_404672 [Ochromonadaceae sp. CCMP2298]|nr:hypothetical protein B484DRAFT_404672 [Ochromonadaceae sp. CCMP2298]
MLPAGASPDGPSWRDGGPSNPSTHPSTRLSDTDVHINQSNRSPDHVSKTIREVVLHGEREQRSSPAPRRGLPGGALLEGPSWRDGGAPGFNRHGPYCKLRFDDGQEEENWRTAPSTGGKKKAKESPSDSSNLSTITAPTDSQSSGVSEPPLKRSRETAGVSGEQFLSGMYDFRSFGRSTYSNLVEAGVIADLFTALAKYKRASTSKARAQVLVPEDELPLSAVGMANLHERVLAVRAMLQNMQNRYEASQSLSTITSFSDECAGLLQSSGKRIRRWTQQFIVNEGLFKGVGYKCRPSSSIIHDNAARAQMTAWMVNASTAKPPAKAADFYIRGRHATS